MTKLLTIDVQSPKGQEDILYIVNVIANDQENILILKDLIDDREQNKRFHCIGIKLNHCFQHCYEVLPPLCTQGQIFVKCNDNMDIDKAIESIAQIILSFIL